MEKVKVEPCGARGSHLLPPQPANLWWCSMRCCLAVQNELQDTSQNSKTWKEKRKKGTQGTPMVRRDLAALLSELESWGVAQQRGRSGPGITGVSWDAGENQSKSRHSNTLLLFLSLSSKCLSIFIHQIFQFCSVHTAFPVWASRPPRSLPRVPCVSWEQPGALGALLPPPCIENFWEQEATLQLLQIAEKPWPLGLSFSRICAFHRPQMNFKKHWSHFIFPKAFQGLS